MEKINRKSLGESSNVFWAVIISILANFWWVIMIVFFLFALAGGKISLDFWFGGLFLVIACVLAGQKYYQWENNHSIPDSS